MNINKININQTEPTYYIASDIYDVSAHNNGATFESLSALFSDENLSTLIPSEVRCGGMTICFVQSSINMYVQYRYMLKNATDNSVFTNRVNWNLVERESIIHILKSTTIPIEYFIMKVLARESRHLFFFFFFPKHTVFYPKVDFFTLINPYF